MLNLRKDKIMNSKRIKQLHAGGRSISSLAQQFEMSEKEIKAVLYVTTIYNEKPQENKTEKVIEQLEEFFDYNEEEEYGNDTEEDEQE